MTFTKSQKASQSASPCSHSLILALRETFECEGPALLDVKIAANELTMPPRIEASQAWGFSRAKIKEWLQGDAD